MSCAICQQDLEAESTTTLACQHCFHVGCALEQFRRGDPRCPCCRDNPYSGTADSDSDTVSLATLDSSVDDAYGQALRRRVLVRARRQADKRPRETWLRCKLRARTRWATVYDMESVFMRSAAYKSAVRMAAGADRSEVAAGTKYVAPVLALMPQGDVHLFRRQNPDLTK